MNVQEYYDLLGDVYAERVKVRLKRKEGQESIEDTVSARDLVLGIYDDNKIGLFIKKPWVGKVVRDEWTGFNSYDAGIIYIGMNNDLTGIKRTHYGIFSDDSYGLVGSECSLIDGTHYVVNCELNDEFSYNEVRLSMLDDNLITVLDMYKTTEDEMSEVLAYASKNYRKQKPFAKRLTK